MIFSLPLRKISIVKSIISTIPFLVLTVVAFAQADQPKMRKNEIKVALLSLASGTSKVTYERLVRDYQSIELTAGVIGWGFDKLKDSSPRGTTWRLAYKFILPDKHNGNNQMCGFYIKPELCYSTYRYNHPYEGRLKVDRMALMGVIGYDWVLQWFVFDIYGGLGLACGNSNLSNYHHGFIGARHDSPTAFTAGFRIGVAF